MTETARYVPEYSTVQKIESISSAIDERHVLLPALALHSRVGHDRFRRSQLLRDADVSTVFDEAYHTFCTMLLNVYDPSPSVIGSVYSSTMSEDPNTVVSARLLAH